MLINLMFAVCSMETNLEKNDTEDDGETENNSRIMEIFLDPGAGLFSASNLTHLNIFFSHSG